MKNQIKEYSQKTYHSLKSYFTIKNGILHLPHLLAISLATLTTTTLLLGTKIQCGIENIQLDKDKLKEKGITFRKASDSDPSEFVAGLIFKAMNNTQKPRYTTICGLKKRDARTTVRAMRRGDHEPFDETDLFIHLHTRSGIIQTSSSLEKKEIEDTFKTYGVIPFNGLHPEKRSHLLLGCGHDSSCGHDKGHDPHNNTDTIDRKCFARPDVLLDWGDKAANKYLSSISLKEKYAVITDEGPMLALMTHYKDYFTAVRSCLADGGKLQIPTSMLKRKTRILKRKAIKIPNDFVKDTSFSEERPCCEPQYTTYTHTHTKQKDNILQKLRTFINLGFN